jgi:hypothetical protein
MTKFEEQPLVPTAGAPNTVSSQTFIDNKSARPVIHVKNFT